MLDDSGTDKDAGTPSDERPQPFFIGSDIGQWRIDSIQPVVGRGLSPANRLKISRGVEDQVTEQSAWKLCGVTSNVRYTQRNEIARLSARQETIGRPTASRAALIPIRKNKDWWALAQDERRMIFEAQSMHIALGMEYLPAVARRLHHSRDLANGIPKKARRNPANDELRMGPRTFSLFATHHSLFAIQMPLNEL
jgi:hypothetical protein